MHVEPWGGVLAAGAHVRTVRIRRILASHIARLAGQIVHEGGRVESGPGCLPPTFGAGSADSWTRRAERSGTWVTNLASEQSWRRSCWNACPWNPRLRAD